METADIILDLIVTGGCIVVGTSTQQTGLEHDQEIFILQLLRVWY